MTVPDEQINSYAAEGRFLKLHFSESWDNVVILTGLNLREHVIVGSPDNTLNYNIMKETKKTNIKTIYVAPAVEIMYVRVESGFASSGNDDRGKVPAGEDSLEGPF